MPYATQGVTGLDDDDNEIWWRKYLMQNSANQEQNLMQETLQELPDCTMKCSLDYYTLHSYKHWIPYKQQHKSHPGKPKSSATPLWEPQISHSNIMIENHVFKTKIVLQSWQQVPSLPDACLFAQHWNQLSTCNQLWSRLLFYLFQMPDFSEKWGHLAPYNFFTFSGQGKYEMNVSLEH